MSAGRSNGRQDGTFVARGRPHMLVPGAAAPLSVMILIILLLTSFSTLSVTALDGQALGATSNGNSSDHANSDTAKQSHRPAYTGWNWDEYVDESGNVRVIVSSDASEPLDDLMAKAVKKVDPDSRWTSDVRTSKVLAVKSHLKHTLDAFTIETKPGVLRGLLAEEPALWAYPDFKMNATEVTENIIQTGADQLWSSYDGSPATGLGVSVAVIDTGIDYSHPDLGGGFGPGHRVVGGYDFVNSDDDPMDDNGHGTHVAGIIAANGGIKGVAPDATLYAYKALGADGSGYMSDVVLAIDTAIDPNGDGSPVDHVAVISMSLGGKGDSDDPICQAVQRAVEAGVLVVVAAGNSGPTMGTVASPGLSPYSLTVGALDSDHNLADFSSRGPTADLLVKPDISAPGVAIRSTVPFSISPSGYKEMSGTSMATPHVSGAAALLKQSHPSWSVTQIRSALVTSAKHVNDSLWEAGSGELWLPGADSISLFIDTPLISYGRANSPSPSVRVTNGDGTATFSISSVDFRSLSADGSVQTYDWTNYSSVSPPSMSLAVSGSGLITLTISVGAVPPEGYYDGYIRMASSGIDLHIPFGYMVLSQMTVHVLDLLGREVYDPYGGVWVYSIPDAMTAIGKRGGNGVFAPPATFLLPSGTYSVHSAGHQLLYTYSDPYFLSKVVTLGRVQTLDVNLTMSDAHAVVLNLQTEQSKPIYVKDFRMHARYEGERNLSFDLTGSDYSVFGTEVFNITTSRTLRVSDTAARVGFQVSGFSYTNEMWDFMDLNQAHWFEFSTGTSTAFLVESTADLQYLLAWEFPAVDSLFPSTLSYDINQSSRYTTRYDIPGSITEPWCNWDTHRSMGGDAAFYVRRDTDTSLNPFFSGMTRTTIVSGVFTELYYPLSLFGGYIERQYYSADYAHVLHAATPSEIYLPNRYFLEPLAAANVTQTVGSGPLYPSVYTHSNNTALILYQPLLRDQNGWRVGGMTTPMLTLYRGGSVAGIYQLAEHLARPDAMRIIDLTADGTYTAKISYSPMAELYNQVLIELGFTVPGVDVDPPTVTGMVLEQKYSPGQTIPFSVSVADDTAVSSVDLQWRAGPNGTWAPLAATSDGLGRYTTEIGTSSADPQIDVKFTVTDSTGNFIRYTAYNASLPEIPLVFELNTSVTEVQYKSTGTTIQLTGKLTDSQGKPLHSMAAVPIELMVDGRKVGMILDENVTGSSHRHDGTIRFDWIVKPKCLFTAVGQTISLTASIDLGRYQAITRTITLTSISSSSIAPNITLVSPTASDPIAAGTIIDLEIVDDGLFTAQYSVNGGVWLPLISPWDIATDDWPDGIDTLSVTATDDDLLTAPYSHEFEIDALAPSISIEGPSGGSAVPRNYTVVVVVYDARLTSVSSSVDGMPSVPLDPPYTISTAGWGYGLHWVNVTAVDVVGHVSAASTCFNLTDSSVVAAVLSPSTGVPIKPGALIQLAIIGDGVITCTWDAGSGPVPLTSPYTISTDGWTDGIHSVRVDVSNDLGDSFSFTFEVEIDSTAPTFSLEYPLPPGYFIRSNQTAVIRVDDDHFANASWSAHGESGSNLDNYLMLHFAKVHQDGAFEVHAEAHDLAGNFGQADFVLQMDSGPPTIVIQGLSKGAAVTPNAIVHIEVRDAYLSQVLLSLDDSTTAIDPVFNLTIPATLGWHNMSITARDYAGFQNVTGTISFYVDGVIPAVAMASGDEFVEAKSFQVCAELSDDFQIANAVLYYELPGGGFQHIQMSYNGTYYVAILPAEVLWDGMELYVVATDAVGHTGTGATQVLEQVSANNTEGSGLAGLLSTFNLILLTGAIAAAAVIIALFMLYRRRRDAPWEEDEQDKQPEPRPELKAVEPLAPPMPVLEPARPVQAVSAQQTEAKPQFRVPEPEPEKTEIAQFGPEEAPKMKKVELIDAISKPLLTQEPENQKFYDDFLEDLERFEREINDKARRGSVYMQDEELMKLFDLDDKLETDQPKKVSGLKWKKLME